MVRVAHENLLTVVANFVFLDLKVEVGTWNIGKRDLAKEVSRKLGLQIALSTRPKRW